MRRCKMFMKLSTFSVYIELEWHFWVRYQWQDSQVVQSEKCKTCIFVNFFFGCCWVIVRDLPSLWGDVGEEMWKTPPIEEQGRHAIRGAGDTWAEGRQRWEFKETYSCSKQAYEATTRQVAKEEYTLTHNLQATHLDLPSDSQAWTAKWMIRMGTYASIWIMVIIFCVIKSKQIRSSFGFW